MKPELLLEQIKTWKKNLGILQQQNIIQKNRLAEIMKTEVEKERALLEQAEHFQNCFLQQDDALRLMRNDIAVFERMIVCEEIRPGKYWEYQDKKLNAEIQTLKTNYNRLSAEFAAFLLGVGQVFS